MKIEIVKPFKLLEVGKQLDIDREYSLNLIKRGIAKSLEPEVEVEAEIEVKGTKSKMEISKRRVLYQPTVDNTTTPPMDEEK